MSESTSEAILLPLSQKCPVLNTIAAYQAVPYQQGDKDGSFIIRLIELNTFLNNRDLLTLFTQSTGYIAPPHLFTPEEAVLLLEKSSELIKRLNTKHVELKNNIASIETANNANKVGDYHKILAHADKIAYQKRRAEDELNQLQEKESAIYSLIALLNPWVVQSQAEHPHLFKPHQAIIQQIARFQAGNYAVNMMMDNFREAVTSLANLTSALKTVTDALQSLPIKTSYFLNNNKKKLPDPIEVIRLSARRTYYRPAGEVYRNTLTIEEYEKHVIKEHEIASMPQNFIEARRRHGDCTLSF
ncbi:hypothetical protein AB6H26_01265 [Providencia hangzhouensis]|uniref:hypothetical protein n=1 Tax=Providencia hangzhouensis TaxID=3031799 RepID=UPI0034DD2476